MSFLRFQLLAAAQLVLFPLAVVAMPIFTKGTEQAVVVVPDDPSPVTLHAGRELVAHLNLATGGSFTLKEESELLAKEGPYRIYVGASKAASEKGIKIGALEKNHYIIYPAPEALYLAGQDDLHGDVPADDTAAMASLLAVYEWLDRAVGVRWLWPGEAGRVVPQFRELMTQEGPPFYGKPSLSFSNVRFYSGYYNRDKPSRYGRSESLDDRSFLMGSEWLRRQKIVRTSGSARFYGHGFGPYWERFGKEHPEWFALRPDGKRGPVDSRTSLVQLCVSNPELHQQIIRDWLESRTPERPWINGCENDRRAIDPFCHCEPCKAWDVPEALVSVRRNPWHIESRSSEQIDPYEKTSMSDRYARFLLALLKEGKKHDPNAKVVGYAYSFYSDAPVEVKLNSDVVIIYVPPYVYPLAKGSEDLAINLWDRWKATGATMIYRPNDFLVGYPPPYIYPTQFGRDFAHYLKDGVVATDFDSCVGAWGTQGINLYLMGRLHARPDLTPEAMLDEYCSAFGPASEVIRRYLAYWESVTSRCDPAFQDKVNGGWAVMMRAAHKIYTAEAYAEGQRILSEAAEIAKGDLLVARRVNYLKVWLEHAAISTEAIEVYRSFNAERPTPDDRERFNHVYRKLKAFRVEHDEELVGANWGLINRWEPWRNWKE